MSWNRNNPACSKFRVNGWAASAVMALLAGLAPVAGLAQETRAAAETEGDAPLSAVDWLDGGQALAVTPFAQPGGEEATSGEPPVAEAGGADTPDVAVRPLDAPSVSAVGLLPPSVTGLPLSLWRGSDPVRLSRLIETVEADQLPAIQALMFSLLLAEADPPAAMKEGVQGEALLLARLDRLRAQGAVAPALALVERAGIDSPARFARWFDLMLLTGETDRACSELVARRTLSADMAARVYCLTLTGNWETAVFTLDAARALGTFDPAIDDLLSFFVDPEMAEEMPLPQLGDIEVTPLVYRLLQALGEAPGVGSLPRDYAALALEGDVGWRAQIEAAERLARAGAAPANLLVGAWSERRPAASGGIWDRVAAIQALDTAVSRRDPEKVAHALPRAWQAAQDAGLAVPVAGFFAEPLAKLPLEGPTAQLARDLIFLSPDYELAGAAYPETPLTGTHKLAAALAAGAPMGAPVDDHAAAIARAFAQLPEDEADTGRMRTRIAGMVATDRLGEAILMAMRDTIRGAGGDLVALSAGLRALRALGLEDTARRAALQLLILGPVT